MSNSLALQQIKSIEQTLKSAFPQIKSVVSNNISPEKMARVVVNELSSNSYLRGIAAENPNSLILSVMQSSQLGLEVGGHLGQAYLVPFYKNYKDDNGKWHKIGEIKLIVGYRGLISLARRSGEITSINAEIVYEKDEFDLSLGLEPKVIHKPFLKGERGDPVLVYMSAHFKDGGHHFEWMTIGEVNKIRDNSEGYKASKKNNKTTPWDSSYEEMVRKTVIRRGWKYLPMSVEMQNAQVVETANDTGKQSGVIDGQFVIIDDGDIDDKEVKNTENESKKPFSLGEILRFKHVIESGEKKANELISELQSTGRALSDNLKMEIAGWQPIPAHYTVDDETGEIVV